ncbi:MAG: hypothetical protein LBM72_00125, partial [Mycoplasmataceae bacterium]|nr:hypothetical protein [Mycoplasmataceae bacterium]
MTDQELTYLYQTEHINSAYEIIKHKYRSSLKRLTWNLVDETFYSLPLDYKDFNSTMYYSLIDCLEHYNTKQIKYSFIQALIIVNRTHVLRYAGKFVRN